MPGELVPSDRNELRASHEDRDLIVDRLRVAAGDGRIDADELDQRIEAAMSARTYGELDVVVKDLPESPEAAARTVARRAEAIASQTISLQHSRAGRTGAWLVPQQLAVTASHSHVVLDFTEAVFSGERAVDIELDLRHSKVTLILPPGSTVDQGSLDRGHSAFRERNSGAPGPDSVRIRVSGEILHSAVSARGLPRFQARRRLRRAAIGR